MAVPFIRRACMYVPASSEKMLAKSLTLTVDNLTYDLEDSVAPHLKSHARTALRSILSQPRPSGVKELCVRINSVSSGLALDDLREVVQSEHLDAVMLPKCDSAADLHFVTDVIRHLAPERHPSSTSSSSSISHPTSTSQQRHLSREPLRIIALIESAKSILALPAITTASPYLSGLVFAAEDFASDLSITRTPSLTEFLYARSAIVTAARAAQLPSAIDLVCTQYRGEEGLRMLEEECVGGKGLGFNGKQCIHPSQIAVCERAFAPGKEEVDWATRVVVADAKAGEKGRGAWTLDGKMVDVPVVKKAVEVLRYAEACGINVRSARERWSWQEPE